MNDFTLMSADPERWHWTDGRDTTEVSHPPGADNAVHVLVFGGPILHEDGSLEDFDYQFLHPPVCGYVDIHTAAGTGVEYRDFSCGHEAVLDTAEYVEDVIDTPDGGHLSSLAPGLYETRFRSHQGATLDDCRLDIAVLGEITSEVPL